MKITVSTKTRILNEAVVPQSELINILKKTFELPEDAKDFTLEMSSGGAILKWTVEKDSVRFDLIE